MKETLLREIMNNDITFIREPSNPSSTMWRGFNFTVGSSILANAPKGVLFALCLSQYSVEESGKFSSRLQLGSCLLPGLALFYPLELARMQVMTDASEPKRGGFGILKEIAAKGNSFKAVYHGIEPYMAHHTLKWSLFLAICTYVSPFLAPVATTVAYPLNTIWTRMAIEAGKEQKKFENPIKCFEHIMKKESYHSLWTGYGFYVARNSVLWFLLGLHFHLQETGIAQLQPNRDEWD